MLKILGKLFPLIIHELADYLRTRKANKKANENESIK